jgi:hypothetical protein
MSAPEILGEAGLDTDGMLHGWCWSPRRPEERLTLDILLDGAVIATVVASRFREDVRNRKCGDGYHGFAILLTGHLSRMQGQGVLAVRERVSGGVFWQKIFGPVGLPDWFDSRLAALRGQVGACGARMPTAFDRRRDFVASGFGAAGARLRRDPVMDARLRTGRARPAKAVALPHVAAPRLSLVLDGGNDAAATRGMIAAAAGVIGELRAELILIDRGGDPETALLPSRIPNLRYFYDDRSGFGPRRNMAAEFCRGRTILFLRNTGRRFDLGLAAFAQLLTAQVPIAAAAPVAAMARRLAPAIRDWLTWSTPLPYLGLDVAVDRELFAACGGFDELAPEDRESGMATFLLRAIAAADGGQALVANEPTAAGSCPADGFLPLG